MNRNECLVLVCCRSGNERLLMKKTSS